MRVRCGRCRSELDAPGPGTFVCPACGAQNQIKGGADPQTSAERNPTGGTGGLTVPPKPPKDDTPPKPRVTCGRCSFEFAVGDIELAICPMCESEVVVKSKEAS